LPLARKPFKLTAPIPCIAILKGGWRRHWSAFKDGLNALVETAQQHAPCPDLLFIPDKRFT